MINLLQCVVLYSFGSFLAQLNHTRNCNNCWAENEQGKKSDIISMVTGPVLRGRSYLYSGSLVYFVHYLTEQQLNVKLYAVTLMDTTAMNSMSGFFASIFLAQ